MRAEWIVFHGKSASRIDAAFLASWSAAQRRRELPPVVTIPRNDQSAIFMRSAAEPGKARATLRLCGTAKRANEAAPGTSPLPADKLRIIEF
jgi:hypothetical protein